MKKHTKIYLDEMGYTDTDTIFCECCPAVAVDIHHIESRGMGGDPTGKRDVIENLMAVCRECHLKYGDKEQHKEYLKEVHTMKMIRC